jgi:hypothetical protein
VAIGVSAECSIVQFGQIHARGPAMKSLGWIIAHEGRRIWAKTKAEARHVAQLLADASGKKVTVRPAKTAPGRQTVAKRTTMKRNPDPSSFIDVWVQQAKHRAQRADYVKRTRPVRIQKSDVRRGRAAPAAKKTGKFLVDAKRGREVYTLYRSSRRQADELAATFKEAGFTVNVKEV